jgi:hypothetical protein
MYNTESKSIYYPVYPSKLKKIIIIKARRLYISTWFTGQLQEQTAAVRQLRRAPARICTEWVPKKIKKINNMEQFIMVNWSVLLFGMINNTKASTVRETEHRMKEPHRFVKCTWRTDEHRRAIIRYGPINWIFTHDLAFKI